MSMSMSKSAPFWLVVVLLVALIGRVLLLASGSVSFHSDEAVVGLMARHILQGERPVFFYGQAYMGSLDPWLIALGFRLLGESVLTIRIVQSTLYLLTVASSYALAWRISGRMLVATVAALLIAVPNVLLALYSTATLGGYNETLLLGSLILLLAWDVTHEHRGSLWRWALLGLCAGLGWWTNGLIIAYVVPASVLILLDLWRNFRLRPTDDLPLSDTSVPRPIDRQIPVAQIGIAFIAFLIGSAPWWIFNFQYDFAALRFYLPSNAPSQFAGTDIAPLPTDQRLIGLFLLGLPAVIGLRFPWMPGFFLPAVGILVLLVYCFAIYRLLRREPLLKPDGRLLVIGMMALFCALFVVSRFSIDPTGRYFLPLTLPLAIVFATLVAALRQAVLRVVLVALLLGYHAAGVITAVATNPPGMTTQFNLETHLPNDDDAALISFLDEHGLTHGYTNYWVAFRLAFLSGDRLQYRAVLPYKTDLSYTPFDERYAPYREATDAAPDDQIAYVTANVASVKARLEAIFAERGVTYQYAPVGIYHVYYDFAPAAPRPPLAFID
jgi:4-amino-4-deoxy-L-arabinose transferase-like glycosyltransferase